MLHYDFENSMGYWVVLTAHAFQRALDAELTRHGITFRQWQVLAWLALEGELAQNELAERIGIEAPTLVGVLDRMERDGWLRRHPCPDDRRKKLVRPTGRAENVWSKMVECALRVRKQALSGLSERRLEAVKNALQKMQQNLSFHPGVQSLLIAARANGTGSLDKSRRSKGGLQNAENGIRRKPGSRSRNHKSRITNGRAATTRPQGGTDAATPALARR